MEIYSVCSILALKGTMGLYRVRDIRHREHVEVGCRPTSSTSLKAYRLCIPQTSQAPGTSEAGQREGRASRVPTKFRVEKVGGCDALALFTSGVAEQRGLYGWLASAGMSPEDGWDFDGSASLLLASLISRTRMLSA